MGNSKQKQEPLSRYSTLIPCALVALLVSCQHNPSPIESLAEVPSLQSSSFVAPFFYWTSFSNESGAIQRFNVNTKARELIATTPHHPQQVTAQPEGIYWFQRSTSYDEPNRICLTPDFVRPSPKFGRTGSREGDEDFVRGGRGREGCPKGGVRLEFLPREPAFLARAEGTYFINRGRLLQRIDHDQQIESIVKLPGSALSLQSSDKFLYVREREFNGVVYSHDALLQIDPASKQVNTILGPPWAIASFTALPSSIIATAQGPSSDFFMVDISEAGVVEKLYHTPSPLSLVTAMNTTLFFIQQDGDSFSLYRKETNSNPTPIAGPWTSSPIILFVDQSFVYWVVNDALQRMRQSEK